MSLDHYRIQRLLNQIDGIRYSGSNHRQYREAVEIHNAVYIQSLQQHYLFQEFDSPPNYSDTVLEPPPPSFEVATGLREENPPGYKESVTPPKCTWCQMLCEQERGFSKVFAFLGKPSKKVQFYFIYENPDDFSRPRLPRPISCPQHHKKAFNTLYTMDREIFEKRSILWQHM